MTLPETSGGGASRALLAGRDSACFNYPAPGDPEGWPRGLTKSRSDLQRPLAEERRGQGAIAIDAKTN